MRAGRGRPREGRPRGWPDPLFDDLLRAAAGPPDGAVAAWRRFHSSFDIDDVDGDSYRLLATVAGNLPPAPIGGPDEPGAADVPDRGRLAGIARRSWFANQRALANLGRVVSALDEEGIPVLVAKGAALAPTVFPGVAHRPFADVDLYVRPVQWGIVTEWFLDHGYERPPWPPELDGRHAVGFRRGPIDGGDVFDVHNLPPEALRLRRAPERSADALWEGSVPLHHGGVRTRAVGPAEQLVIVLVHGFDVRSESPLRGFADAAWIVRSTAEALDWARVVRFANERRVHLEVHAGLRYVHEVIGVDVPASVLARPGHWVRSTPRDHALRWARTGPHPRGRTGAAGAAQRWLLRTEADVAGDVLRDLAGYPVRRLTSSRG